MTLRKRGTVYLADHREMGGGRQSLFTEDKDTARVLHNEVEQRVLRGERVTSQVVRAMLTAMTSPRAQATSALMGATPVAAEARGAAGVTMKQAFDLALINREDWRTSRSRLTITSNFGAVAEYFGSARTLDSITSADMARYKASMVELKLSGSTINQRLSIVSVLFSEAKAAGHPVMRPDIVRAKSRSTPKHILSRETEQRVIAWFAKSNIKRDVHMVDLVPVLLDTGFRVSELLTLLDGQGIKWESGYVCAQFTKADIPRSVPMTARVREILKRRVEQYGAQPFAGLTLAQADSRWSSMRKALGMGVDKAFVIHALRHTCCTRLALAGMDPFKIMKWMGHASITTTMIYVNLAGANLDSLRDSLEAHVKCASVQPALGGAEQPLTHSTTEMARV